MVDLEFSVGRELLALGYNQNNRMANLTPVFSKDGKRIYITNNGFGVMIYHRDLSDTDEHVCIQLLIENNGLWQEGVYSFSAYWLPDLRELFKWVSSYLKERTDLFRKIELGYEFID